MRFHTQEHHLQYSGAVGFTGSEMTGGNSYTDYLASLSTSAFGLDLGCCSYTTVDGYGADVDMDQVTFSVGKSLDTSFPKP